MAMMLMTMPAVARPLPCNCPLSRLICDLARMPKIMPRMGPSIGRQIKPHSARIRRRWPGRWCVCSASLWEGCPARDMAEASCPAPVAAEASCPVPVRRAARLEAARKAESESRSAAAHLRGGGSRGYLAAAVGADQGIRALLISAVGAKSHGNLPFMKRSSVPLSIIIRLSIPRFYMQ